MVMRMLMVVMTVMIHRFEFLPVLSLQGEGWQDQLTMVAGSAGDNDYSDGS